MKDKTDFRAIRRTGLGGSDLGTILGWNKWQTPFQLWLEKTGRIESFDGNLQTRFGQYAEMFVAGEYQAATGRRVQRLTATLRHPTAPVLGHIDRLVIPDGAKIAAYKGKIRTDLGLECKTAHALAASRSDEWGEGGTDQVPPSYLIQCQVYMALTGCPHWDLAVLFGNSAFQIYHLHRDLELEGMILEEASRWWRDYVLADTPPPPSSELEARQRWAAHQPGKILSADADLARDLADLKRVKTIMADLERQEQALKDRIMPRLEDADTITWNGTNLATYRANKASQRTDWHLLAEEEFLPTLDPDTRARLLAEYTATLPGARVLRLAKSLEAA